MTSPARSVLRGSRLRRRRLATLYAASFASHTREIELIVGQVLRAIVQAMPMQDQLPDIEIALREALANAILHGNGGNRRKRVRVECYRQDLGSLLVVVRDNGKGFDPARLGDPTQPENLYRDSGRGIYLIRHFMDEVEFARRGREIRMRKRL